MNPKTKKRIAKEILLFWTILLVNLIVVVIIGIYNYINSKRYEKVDTEITKIYEKIYELKFNNEPTAVEYLRARLASEYDIPEMDLFVEKLQKEDKLKALWKELKNITIVLEENKRIQLDSIISQMIQNKKTDDTIQLVVNDFKNKYGKIELFGIPEGFTVPENEKVIEIKEDVSALIKEELPPLPKGFTLQDIDISKAPAYDAKQDIDISKRPSKQREVNYEELPDVKVNFEQIQVTEFSEFKSYVSEIIKIYKKKKEQNEIAVKKHSQFMKEINHLYKKQREIVRLHLNWDKIWQILFWISICGLILLYPIRGIAYSFIWAIKNVKENK